MRIVAGISGLLERRGYLFACLTLVLITAASLAPGGSSGDPGTIGVYDGLAHLVAYMIVIFFIASTPSTWVLQLSIMVLAWSGIIEILQPLVGRSGSFLDFVANAAGVVVGLYLGSSARRLILRKRSEEGDVGPCTGGVNPG